MVSAQNDRHNKTETTNLKKRTKNSEIESEILEVLENFWPEECSKKEILKALSDKGVRCAHGTFYNIISKLIRQNRVISNRFSYAKYKYNKSKNENYPIGDISSTFLNETGFVNTVMELISANGFEDICKIHDIHLKTDFWNIESFQELRQRSCKRWHHEKCYVWKENTRSKSWKIDLRVGNSHKVTFQVYSTGVLTCSIKCTGTPFPEKLEGLSALQSVINEACLIIFDERKFWTFPVIDDWIVTFWHHGRDSKPHFKCKFEVTFRNFFGGLARIYVRKKDGRLRLEEFQSPCEPLGLLLHEVEIKSKENFSSYRNNSNFSKLDEKIEILVEKAIDVQLRKMMTSFFVQTFKN